MTRRIYECRNRKRPTPEQITEWAKTFPRQIDYGLGGKTQRYFHRQERLWIQGGFHGTEGIETKLNAKPVSALGVVTVRKDKKWFEEGFVPFNYKFEKYLINYEEMEKLLGIDNTATGINDRDGPSISLRVGEYLFNDWLHVWDNSKPNAYVAENPMESLTELFTEDGEKKIIPVLAVPVQFFRITKESYRKLKRG